AIAAGGGDEISARDQNIALANLRRIVDKTNVHIATIGHTGKDEGRGERGSNAKLADVDLQVQITGDDSTRTVHVRKGNDQPEGVLTSFQLKPYQFGADEDGDTFQTYILSGEVIPTISINDRKLTDRQRLALAALAEAILSYGVDPSPSYGLPANIKTITEDQWQTEMLRRGVLDSGSKNQNHRARLVELRNALAARHIIGALDGKVWQAQT